MYYPRLEGRGDHVEAEAELSYKEVDALCERESTVRKKERERQRESRGILLNSFRI